MPNQGAAAYSPLGFPTPVDANWVTYGATTLGSLASAGATSLTLGAASVFGNGDVLTLEAGTANQEPVFVTSGGGTTALTIVGLGTTGGTKNTHANGAAIALIGTRQLFTASDPATPANQQSVDSRGNAHVAPQDTVVATAALSATNASSSTPITSGQSTVRVQISGTWTGTLVFQETSDGVTWTNVYGRIGTGTSLTPVASYADTGSGTTRFFTGLLGGGQTFRVIMTPYTSGTANVIIAASYTNNSSYIAGGAVAVADGATPTNQLSVTPAGTAGTNGAATQGMPNGVPMPISDEPTTATYSASFVGAAALASDLLTITGSASKVVRIRRIVLTGLATTATMIDVTVNKRSTADTGGTSTGPTRVPSDSTNPAATAVVALYTVAPTLGTLVGAVRSQKMFLEVIATAAQIVPLDFEWDTSRNGQAIVLRNAAEQLCVTLSATAGGSSIDGYIEWTESST